MAESEWVKVLAQRGMGVLLASRVHDLLKAASAHQIGARADLGITVQSLTYMPI